MSMHVSQARILLTGCSSGFVGIILVFFMTNSRFSMEWRLGDFSGLRV